MYSTIENFLTNFSFLILFLSMIIYWVEISNVSLASNVNQSPGVAMVLSAPITLGELKKPENTGNSAKVSFGQYGMFIANIAIFLLLILRWKESGHFPLSNLYESLMFLSWTLTTIHISLDYLVFWGTHKTSFNQIQATQTHASSPKVPSARGTLSPLPTEGLPPTGLKAPLVGGPSVVAQELCMVPPTLRNSAKPNFEGLHVHELEGTSCVFAGESARKLVSQEVSNNSLISSFGATQNKNKLFISLLLGSITSPSALLTNAFATFSLPKEMQEASPLVPALQSNWLMMHVTVMILSYGALILGSLLSVAFLVITGGDELTNPSTKSALESIGSEKEAPVPSSAAGFEIYKLAQTFDNLSYRILGIGFPFLTIGILSGAVWANEAWGSYWSWDPKETWALLTWLVFAIYLHTRLNKGWEGRKPALIATLGLISVWICYLGVNLLGEGLHSYGWFTT
jgi:cytochrome c-type biogenesis protein CcsB